MSYNKKQIFEFLVLAREGSASDAVLTGALMFVEGLTVDDDISEYLNSLSGEGDVIPDLVDRIHDCLKKRSESYLVSYGKTPVKERFKQLYKYAGEHIEELLVLSAFAKVQYDALSLNNLDTQIIEALRRSNHNYEDLSNAEIGEHLSLYSDEQLQGIVNNVKGIAHEIKFTDAENADGDQLFASMFGETNHPGTDVNLTDSSGGFVDEVQLKATDSESYVKDWIEEHPDGRIIVTDEIATKLNLESSGISNGELTYETEEVIDKLINASDGDTVWSYFPYISTVSLALVVYSFWGRYSIGEIDRKTFINKCSLATGIKVAKICVLLVLLSIPVVNVITGSCLAFKFINVFGTIGQGKQRTTFG